MKHEAVAKESPQKNDGSALAGRMIVNTRAIHQASALDELLQQHGAMPLPYPCIDIVPPEDITALDDALRQVINGQYDWIVFTSSNAVTALAERLGALAIDHPLNPTKVAAIGPATSLTIRKLLGRDADVMAESLAAAIHPSPGAAILLPQSAIARPTLAQHLTTAGAKVTVIEAYRTVIGSGGINLHDHLQSQQIDAITLTSSSTFEHLLLRLRNEDGDTDHLHNVCLAAIGSKTAETINTHGFTADVIANGHTLDGLVVTLDNYFRERLNHDAL